MTLLVSVKVTQGYQHWKNEFENEESINLRTSADIDVCLLYTSDAADDRLSVDLGGRRIIKKKIFLKQKTAYEISLGLVGSEMCIRDRDINIGKMNLKTKSL